VRTWKLPRWSSRAGSTDRRRRSHEGPPVRLSYKLYFFCESLVFFSHDKSANSIFSHSFSDQRTGKKKLCPYNVSNAA
jgi:hypothetical protein